MKQSFIKFIYEFFKRLVEVNGFKIKTELKEGQSYMIEYSSDSFVIKIEKYFREFYATLYKINKPDSEINLFNLLEYLKQGSVEIPSSKYFRKEKDIEECYRKQLIHISTVIYENFDLIADFFNEPKYELNVIEFEKYWKNKHPELYNKA
ncbi:hypothetical protein SAMN05421747_1522 [Parapedobacter composti]|uniref:Uncharacterized protein n=1 Tax=Parapedobacter composti TaxID=623281 RepID=A0A1I1MPB2_9SPHI|nr:hypothetical protein [Parapedobacter composti]SFC87191.1 hypothetical protein SAMN05421747_1522 [Parapedobacter composti]